MQFQYIISDIVGHGQLMLETRFFDGSIRKTKAGYISEFALSDKNYISIGEFEDHLISENNNIFEISRNYLSCIAG